MRDKPHLRELKKKLKDFDGKHPKKTLTEVERTERSGLVAAVVKERAEGICQLCNKPAPFYNKKGEPYDNYWRCFFEMLSTCFDILVGIKNNVDDILYRQYSV